MPAEESDPLESGELTLIGQITHASNATLVCDAVEGETTVRCVYKPVRGERPLWDFPDGTLAGREYASYLVSEQLGWGVIPPHSPAGRSVRPGDGAAVGRHPPTGTPTTPPAVSTSSTSAPPDAVPEAGSRSCAPPTWTANRSRSSTPTTRGCSGWRSSTC